jgi:stage II sporulation protein D
MRPAAGRLVSALAVILLPAASACLHAAEPETVRVDVLSRHRPRLLEIRAAGQAGLVGRLLAEDGQASSLEAGRLGVRCDGRAPLEVKLSSRQEVFRGAALELEGAAGGLEVRGQGFERRRFPGALSVRGMEGLCRVTAVVPLESYVEAVACQEIGAAGAGLEALRAQAVVARTYARLHRGKHAGAGADFCDLTHCQVYPGEGACTPPQQDGLHAVRGLVLLHEGRLAEVAYASTCGGHTARAGEVWGPASERPWLRGVPDRTPRGEIACRDSPHGGWRLEVARAEGCAALLEKLPELGSADCRLARVEAGTGGWVRRVRLEAAATRELDGDAFRLLMARHFGWNAFKSGRFTFEARGSRWIFRGQGLGHGVGLCQRGAMGLERDGLGWRAILAHYFPGLEIGRAP